jgi:hypothetical protein
MITAMTQILMLILITAAFAALVVWARHDAFSATRRPTPFR